MIHVTGDNGDSKSFTMKDFGARDQEQHQAAIDWLSVYVYDDPETWGARTKSAHQNEQEWARFDPS